MNILLFAAYMYSFDSMKVFGTSCGSVAVYIGSGASVESHDWVIVEGASPSDSPGEAAALGGELDPPAGAESPADPAPFSAEELPATRLVVIPLESSSFPLLLLLLLYLPFAPCFPLYISP